MRIGIVTDLHDDVDHLASALFSGHFAILDTDRWDLTPRRC
jgi:hypothetical protein